MGSHTPENLLACVGCMCVSFSVPETQQARDRVMVAGLSVLRERLNEVGSGLSGRARHPRCWASLLAGPQPALVVGALEQDAHVRRSMRGRAPAVNERPDRARAAASAPAFAGDVAPGRGR